jgi:hypothetical protein
MEKDLGLIGDYLKNINANTYDIDKIVILFPCLFCYDLEQDFQPTILHLESMGMKLSLLGKLFKHHP